MKTKDHYNDYPSLSLADIGSEMVRASKFEGLYYDLLEKHEALQEKFDARLAKENAHHQHMMGGFLELALGKVK